jgi:CDP-6-deoxy-D-xylo-4-hexulose-3-dehydrase
MDYKYLLAKDTIDEQDLRELIDWLKTNPWLTQGPVVQEFERQWAEWVGTRYATLVNSGSSANLLMYYAALLSGQLKNRKIIVPAVSWATTVAPAIQLGFEPIICDADWTTFGLDMAHLERLLQSHSPGAVIVVHTLGVPAQVDRLLELKERHGFVLMEDACAGFGSDYDGRRVGTFGDVSTFSLYFGHHISTIEGGFLCTNDEHLHDILLHIRSHGWAKDLPADKEADLARSHGALEFNRPFTFYYPGFNVRSSDLNARIGLSQMRRIDWVVRRRVENHIVYQSRFERSEAFHCQRNPRATICSISFVALASSLEHRDRVVRELNKNGIETRPLGGGSMARQPFWVARYGPTSLPVADRIHECSFMLPNHPHLSREDVLHICDVVLAVPVQNPDANECEF